MIKFLNNIEQSLFDGRLTHSQRTGIEFKLIAFKKYGVSDIRHKAYMLATSYHETDKKMQPIEEYGKGKIYQFT